MQCPPASDHRGRLTPMLLRAWRRRHELQLTLDPLLCLGIDLARIAAGGMDRLADHDPYGAALLEQAATRPEVSGVVGDGDHELAGLRGQQCATDSIAAGLTGRH